MKRFTFLLTVFILFSLTPQKIQANLTDGLIANYTFSGNANDVSGNGHNGTEYGVTLTYDRFGNPNSAYKFDGIDDYISVSYHDDFQLPNYTISAWIKPLYSETSLIDGSAIISRGEDFSSDHAALCFGIHQTSSTDNIIYIKYENNHDDDFGYNTDEFPNIDKWSHIAVTRSTKNILSIYLDGNLLESWDSTPIPSSNCFQDIEIGAYWYSPTMSNQYLSNFFNGSIDDVRIYNRALSESDIHSLSVIPVPSAFILSSIGIGALNWLRRRMTI